MSESSPPEKKAVVVADETIVRTRAMLAEVRQDLAAITGGASARSVLAELAQEMSADLAAHFDDLPMHVFRGVCRRERGLLRPLLPQFVPHRVLLGKYHTATVPRAAGSGWATQYARIHVLGIGADGVLRRGTWTGMVRVREGSVAGIEPLDWDSIFLRNVPPRLLRMTRWTATPDAHDVADPARVLAALTAITQRVAAESERDLKLLKRFV